eukprot:GHRR01000486.1.p1 GENE.GHRR01000486.1~~GHRR01000486.1.p1  ORF type:complete len:367 (+),score=85.03 GHRR01000486.1:219-1319(+)
MLSHAVACPFGSKPTRLCRARRAFSAVQARLFHITRLHSHESSVAVETAPDATESLATQPAPSSTVTIAPQAPVPGTRAALQAAAGRKLFYPTENSIQYLDGSLPGDYGWDPLGLADPRQTGQPGEDKVMNLDWLSYAELIHGRWAMLAAAGALAPEILGLAGIIPQETGLPWFEAGGLFSTTHGIQGIPFLGDIPFSYWADKGTFLWTMFCAMGFAECKRLQDYKYPGSQGKQYFLGLENVLKGSGNPKYPGGRFFNLANVGANSPDELFELKVKEVKNGRLAMVAWLGFMSQACTTHKGPVQNLLDHIASPATNNMAARIGDFCTTATPAQQANYVLWLLAGFAAGALYKYSQDQNTSSSSTAA